MCTLSFYPNHDQNGVILTFSRDEMPERSTAEVVRDVDKGLLYPKDALHGGTWLAISEKTGRFTCLLNGAFELHKRQLPYRKSRGLILLESFETQDFIQFCTCYDLDKIEPFTMISLENEQLIEFRWDGSMRHIKFLDIKTPQIWSSCTLYDADMRKQRARWYADFLKYNKIVSEEKLLSFHQTPQYEAPENGILMRRNDGPETVSITQINYLFNPQLIDFQYNECRNNSVNQHQIAYGACLAFL